MQNPVLPVTFWFGNAAAGRWPQSLTPLHGDPELTGKSPADALRHHGAEARQISAGKPVSTVMRIHHLMQKFIQLQRAFAPVRLKPGSPAKQIGRMTGAADAALNSMPMPFYQRGDVERLAARARTEVPAAGGGVAGRLAGDRPSGFAAIGRRALATWRPGPAAIVAATSGGAASGYGGRRVTVQPAAAAAMARATGGAGGGRGYGGRAAWLTGRDLSRIVAGGAGAAAAVSPGARFRSAPGMVSFAPAGRGGAFEATMAGRRASEVAGVPGPWEANAAATTADMPPARRFAPETQSQEAMAGERRGRGGAAADAVREAEVAEAVQAYFFRQSRMPVSSMTGFDPRVSPAWAGLQMSG